MRRIDLIARLPRPATLAIALAFAAAACDQPAAVPPPGGPPAGAISATPRVQIIQPVPPLEGSRLLAGRARVQARCEVTRDPCILLEAFIGNTRVASGASQIDASVSLAGVTGDSVRFRLVATSSRGQKTIVETATFEVEPSPQWTELYTVPGYIQDAAPDRVIYSLLSHSDAVFLRDVATGIDQFLHLESNDAYGLLFPGGAIVWYENVMETKPRGIREFGGSNARDSGGGEMATRGRWAAWTNYMQLRRDDVLAPHVTNGDKPLVEWEAEGNRYDLAEDGTVVYTGYVSYLEEKSDPYYYSITFMDPQLFRLEEGPDTQLTFDSTTVPMAPRTDGTNLVFTRRASQPGRSTYELVLRTPAGEVTLAGPLVASSLPFDYRAEAGWVVYTLPGASGTRQIWARSPSGNVTQVTAPGASSYLPVVGPDAQIVLYSGGRLYLAAKPDAPLVDIGGSGCWPKWFDDKLYCEAVTSFFRIDP